MGESNELSEYLIAHATHYLRRRSPADGHTGAGADPAPGKAGGVGFAGAVSTEWQIRGHNLLAHHELFASLLGWQNRYIFYTMIEFEYDEHKSVSNLKKHGIDFLSAQALWADPDLIEIPARTEDEPRYLIIGLIGSRHWSAAITYREGRTRIISVRRSRSEGVALYESQELR